MIAHGSARGRRGTFAGYVLVFGLIAVAPTTAQEPALGQDKSLLDYVWVMTSAALVFLMQAGFMSLESGLSRAKNSINVAVKNLGDFIVAVLGFWLVGFGVMFGASRGGWIGSGWMLFGPVDPWVATFFVFQAVFVGTAATIVSGAIAERTRFGLYLLLSTLVSVLIYPVFGHWAWGGLLLPDQQGWLEARGFIDFAGSTVVHSIGGWVALAAVILVGPRHDKFDRNGKPRKIQPHSLQLAYLGVFILFFGWFGFNGGSTLEATPDIGGIVLNTVLAAVAAAVGAGAIDWILGEHSAPQPEAIGNGLLGGLVAITAGCAVLTPAAAVLAGVLAGAVVLITTHVLEHTFKLDDVVGAIPVHAFCGAWGTLAVGLFISRTALADMGLTRLELVGVQALGVASAFGWAFGVGLAIAFVIKRTVGLRVVPQDEQIGLNISEHGATSALIGLATKLTQARSVDTYDDRLKAKVEIGTEVGELAALFNELIDALKGFAKTDQHAKRLEAANRSLEERRAQEATLRGLITEQRDRGNQNLVAIAEGVRRELGAIYRQVDRFVAFITELKSFGDQWESTLGAVSGVSQRLRDSAAELVHHTDNAGEALQRSHDQFEATSATVVSLGAYAEKIGSVSEDIDDISGQIRLLSINTAIEAVRAGSLGGGFAVLASEIRQLAENSASSVEHIATTIDQVRETAATLTSNVERLSRTNGELAAFQNTVNVAASHEDEATRTMAQSVGELTESSRRLSTEIAHVSEQVEPLLTAIKQSETRMERIIDTCSDTTGAAMSGDGGCLDAAL